MAGYLAPAGCSTPTLAADPAPEPEPRPQPDRGSGPGGARAAGTPVRYDADDPATWSNRDLAAQLRHGTRRDGRPPAGHTWARMGLGGILISGAVPADLGARLARLRSAASVPPLVASNEEGGSVQRLPS